MFNPPTLSKQQVGPRSNGMEVGPWSGTHWRWRHRLVNTCKKEEQNSLSECGGRRTRESRSMVRWEESGDSQSGTLPGPVRVLGTS